MPHTCKIVNYFFIADLLLAGGPNCQGRGCRKGARGGGKRDGARWIGQGGQGDGIYILMKFSTKQLEH